MNKLYVKTANTGNTVNTGNKVNSVNKDIMVNTVNIVKLAHLRVNFRAFFVKRLQFIMY